MMSQLTLPRISYTLAAETALTEDDRALLDAYLAEVRLIWLRVPSKVSKVVVDLFIDREEDIRTVIATHCVDADADEAIGYWNLIGQELDCWASGVTADKAIAVLDLVSTDVQWRT
jgi:hypothetical protein